MPRRPIAPYSVNMVCPLCGRKIDSDSGPRVDITKTIRRIRAGHLAFAHRSCVEEKVAELKK